jgi:hypothetical protein
VITGKFFTSPFVFEKWSSFRSLSLSQTNRFVGTIYKGLYIGPKSIFP